MSEPIEGVVKRARAVNVRVEQCDVYVGRPSKWGNPFVIGRDGTREEVIAKYRAMVEADPDRIRMIREELRGKRLGCWCSPAQCHADVLAEIAEGG